MTVVFDTTMAGARSNSYPTVAEADTYFANHKSEAVWEALTTDNKKKSLIQATFDIDNNRFRGSRFQQNQSLAFPRHVRTNPFTQALTGKASLQLRQEVFISLPKEVESDKEIIFSQLIETSDIPLFPLNFWTDGEIQVLSGTGLGQIIRIVESSPATGKLTLASSLSPIADLTSKFLVFGPIPMEIKYATFEQALYRSSDDSDSGSDRATLIAQGVKSIKTGNASESYAGRGSGSILVGSAWQYIANLISRTGRIT